MICTAPRRVGALIAKLAVCVALTGCVAGAEAQSQAQQMRRTGATLLAQAPPSVVNGGDLARARYAFARYARWLVSKGNPLNDNAWGRVRYGKQWTCGDHAVNLENIFRGMGIPPSRVFHIKGWTGSPVPTPNSDHGAIVLVTPSGMFVFDPWMMARRNGGSYAGAANSPWNGMGLGAWEHEVRSDGYSQFTTDTRTYHSSAAAACANFAYREKPAKKTAPKRPPGPLQRYIWRRAGDGEVVEAKMKEGTSGSSWSGGPGFATLVTRWGFPEHPGVSPLTLTATHRWTLPAEMVPGKETTIGLEISDVKYTQHNPKARGYTMSTVLRCFAHPPGVAWDAYGVPIGEVGKAVSDESPDRAAPTPVKVEKPFTAPAISPADAAAGKELALKIHCEGGGASVLVRVTYKPVPAGR